MNGDGVSLASAIARGTTTATEAAEAALEAAHADPTNSFTSLDQAALDRAASIDAAGPTGPLAGVPIGVKDLIHHAGRTTTAGSSFYRHQATDTAPALRRLEEAGAVVIGRTGLHEFAFGFSSENPWFGPVRNPWNHDLSPGGSSGGSAAAVAAGIVPIALGTDTGGSVRVPAALCAVAGLKVTHGLIPTDGVFPLVPSLDTVGAIARSLDDLLIANRLMAGFKTWPTARAAPRLVVPNRWVETARSTEEVTQSFDRFLVRAIAVGMRIDTLDLEAIGPSPLQGGIIGPEVAAIHGAWRRQGLPYGEDVAERIDAALEVDEDRADEARAWQQRLVAEMEAVTADGSLLVTPAVAAMDKTIGDDLIGGVHYRTLLSWFTAPVNSAGLPALTMPAAGPGRQPSVQLIGARGAESRLIETARLLEERGILAVNNRV